MLILQFNDIDNDGNEELIATQFFSSKVVIYWTTSGNWSDSTSIQSHLIDDTIVHFSSFLLLIQSRALLSVSLSSILTTTEKLNCSSQTTLTTLRFLASLSIQFLPIGKQTLGLATQSLLDFQ